MVLTEGDFSVLKLLMESLERSSKYPRPRRKWNLSWGTLNFKFEDLIPPAPLCTVLFLFLSVQILFPFIFSLCVCLYWSISISIFFYLGHLLCYSPSPKLFFLAVVLSIAENNFVPLEEEQDISKTGTKRI